MSESYSLIAATLYGNRGAEAMLETVVGRIRESSPGAQFNVFTYYPEDDARILSDKSIALYSSTPVALVAWLMPLALLFGLLCLVFGKRILRVAPRSIRALGESSALIDMAGVAFIDGREKFLPFNVLTLWPAFLLGVPVIKASQAVGPFKGGLNRIAASLTLPRCAKVWARGDQTYEYLQSSGISGINFARADDIAFNHKPSYSLTAEDERGVDAVFARLDAARSSGTSKGVIGLCPSSVVAVQSRKRGENYEGVLASLVKALVADGFIVVLFPNATRAVTATGERNNDLPLIGRVMSAIGAEASAGKVLAFDIDVNATAIKRIIAAMDVVLVSRFHAMIGALSLGIPSAVLGWSHKYAEVMKCFGQQHRVMDYKELSGEELRDQVVALFNERSVVSEQILAALPAIKQSAAQPIDMAIALGRKSRDS